MKSGQLLIIGILLWIILTLFNSLWVYQTHGHLIVAGIIGLCSIIWLTKKQNREELRTTFFSKRQSEIIGGKLLTTIRIGSIAILSFMIVSWETSKFLVRQSEGYDFITSELMTNETLNDRIGKIEYIAIGNRLSAALSFKNSEKRLDTSLIVFGATGQVDIDVKAKKNTSWKIDELKISE